MTKDYFDGDFHSWEAVQRSFEMIEPKPEHIIFAGYDNEGYSGSAYVLFRRGDKYYYVNGSHCSCYGLEGQWIPTVYDSLTELKANFEKFSIYPEEYGTKIKQIVEAL